MSGIFHGLLPIELLIEHDGIDRQHEEIFGRIEAIKEAALDMEALPGSTITELASCFADHFATEERLAREAGIEMSRHAREHVDALRVLTRARADLEGRRLDTRTFLRYLEYWFEHHINQYDKPLGHRLSQYGKPAGIRPAACSGGNFPLPA